MEKNSKLFSPVHVGRYTLANRITMAPLTRCRAGEDGTPTELHAEYYAQRASAGLVVTEGTFPAFSCRSFPGQAGIADGAHVAGWRAVADKVHAAGGTIFMQIMHGGRTSHPDLLRGAAVKAPSALATGGEVRGFTGKMTGPIPEAMTAADIEAVTAEFVEASRRAIEAGLDGVEIHCANGYLLHEFLSPVSNVRTDEFGGSPERRAAFPAQVIRAVADEIGADRVGFRISPEHNIQGVLETDREDVLATYGALLDAVGDVAYLSILHKDIDGELVAFLRGRFDGAVLLNSGFGSITQLSEAQRIVDEDLADAVSVGRLLIANPDLARRWQEGLDLNEPDMSTFYTPGARGYTDYPFVG